MLTEQQQEMACLYAVDALVAEELAQFENELKRDLELQRLTKDLRGVSAALALAIPRQEPPAPLRDKVLGSVHKDEAVLRPDFRPRSTARPMFLGWLPWAAAACLAVTSILSHRRNAALETQSTAQGQRLFTVESELAGWKARDRVSQVKIAMLGSLLQNVPKAVAVSVWDAEKQDGVLVVQNLAPQPADKDYQLWVIDPQQGAPVDAGVFTVDEKGNARFRFKPKVSVKTADKFAVTLEKKGGVPAPQGQMVLAG